VLYVLNTLSYSVANEKLNDIDILAHAMATLTSCEDENRAYPVYWGTNLSVLSHPRLACDNVDTQQINNPSLTSSRRPMVLDRGSIQIVRFMGLVIMKVLRYFMSVGNLTVMHGAI